MGSTQRVELVQYSGGLLTPDDVYRRYYAHAYARMPGYVLPPHYMEIPHWIVQVCGVLPATMDRALHIATDQDDLVEHVRSAPAGTAFLFSVMDCTLPLVLDLARRVAAPLIVGGYVDPTSFDGLPHVTFLDSVADLTRVFEGVDPHGPADYQLFRGERCIPRYRLSDGCGFGCRFCSVSNRVEVVADHRILPEVDALDPLDFDLMYISDKSFGEAPNWRSLAIVRDRVTPRRPGFIGFTVQTTPAISCRDGMLEAWRDLGVRYIEFGVEICDDDQLRRLRKPYRMRQLDATADRARSLGLSMIPDLLLGVPEADYSSTVAWIGDHLDLVPAVNISWLAVEYNNPRGGINLPTSSAADRDQSSDAKTWLSQAEHEHNMWALASIYEATAPGFSFAEASMAR